MLQDLLNLNLYIASHLQLQGTGTRRRGHVDVFLCAPIMRALFFFFRSMLCL